MMIYFLPGLTLAPGRCPDSPGVLGRLLPAGGAVGFIDVPGRCGGRSAGIGGGVPKFQLPKFQFPVGGSGGRGAGGGEISPAFIPILYPGAMS